MRVICDGVEAFCIPECARCILEEKHPYDFQECPIWKNEDINVCTPDCEFYTENWDWEGGKMTRDKFLEFFKEINAYYNNSTMFDTLVNMVDELIQTQQPRVLTLEEAEESDVCWAEVKNVIRISPVRITHRTTLTESFWKCYRFMAVPETFDPYEYGRFFRFWSARPTDEQRKAVKWDG